MPRDMLYRLVNHPSGAMWSLYRSYWPDGVPAVESERNRQLLERLMEWLSIADGGFVGARDRTARQIKRSRISFNWTRSEARALKATKQYGTDRASFALALARRACQIRNSNGRSSLRRDPIGVGAVRASPRRSAMCSWPFCLWLAVVWPVSALLGG